MICIHCIENVLNWDILSFAQHFDDCIDDKNSIIEGYASIILSIKKVLYRILEMFILSLE